MSYQVLARKWRPHTFQSMVGQEHILRMLTNALEQQRLHHAYLFTGTRGVGKTTLARIFAKCLNCEIGITAAPCDHCHACQAIDAGQFLDLYEIDAASRTKIEDTRELLENVPYPPTQGRYKIYLIDEVHMLSNHSFNALLKTLEEPPEHVKFLLATTDPKRLPITILSRCLQFHLKRITPQEITQHLQSICDTEEITYDMPALEKCAKAADGSMRDALSLLDQAIAYGQGTVRINDIQAMLGCLAQDDLLPLLQALALHNGKQLFESISQLAERAPDFHQLFDELIDVLHQLAIAQVVPEASTLEDAYASLVNQFTPEDVQLYYQIALLGRRDLAFSPSPQQGFEMAMLRMLAFKPGFNETCQATEAADSSFLPQVKQVPPLRASSTVTKDKAPLVNTTHIGRQQAEGAADAASSLSSANQAQFAAEWREWLPQLELTGMAYALASNCTLIKKTNDKIELAVSESHRPMLNTKLKERIAEAISRHLKHPTQLEIHVTAASDLITPTKQEHQEQAKRLATAEQTIKQDPQIQKLIAMYDATIEVSVLPT